MPEKTENPDSTVQQAVSAATSSLVAFGLCVACFVPPFSHTITDSVMLTVLAGLGIAVSWIVHIIFVGITAKRMARSATLWVLLAIFLFPLTSIAGLIVLHWSHDEKRQAGSGE